MKRKVFIQTGIGELLGLSLPISARSLTPNSNPDPINNKTIEEFVLAGHGNPEKVKEMLTKIPNLICWRYDCSGGDFEVAIKRAGHVSIKATANYLIDKGARVNSSVLTMLGKTSLVKSVLEAYPSLVSADFLTAQGLKETQFELV